MSTARRRHHHMKQARSHAHRWNRSEEASLSASAPVFVSIVSLVLRSAQA